MSVALPESLRCNWCSRWRPKWRTHTLASRQTICDYCIAWHAHAMDVLGGAAPAGCQVCQRTWAKLREQTPGDEVRMYVVPKDGMMQLLCKECVKPYLPQRADLYGDTEFGKKVLKL